MELLTLLTDPRNINDPPTSIPLFEDIMFRICYAGALAFIYAFVTFIFGPLYKSWVIRARVERMPMKAWLWKTFKEYWHEDAELEELEHG